MKLTSTAKRVPMVFSCNWLVLMFEVSEVQIRVLDFGREIRLKTF